MFAIDDVREAIGASNRTDDDAAAIAAIAAVGPALGDILLAPEGDAPVATVACFYVNDCFIDKHANSNR